MSIPHIRSPMHRAKKGEAPGIGWAKWVEDSVRRLQEDRGSPSRQVFSSGAGEITEPFWTEISQVPESDPPEYQVTVTPGYLIYQQATMTASTQGVTGWMVPKINGIAIDSTDPDNPVEPLPLPDIASWVYLRVKTDSDGAPKIDPAIPQVTIEAFSAAQQSIHHVRPSPSGGEEEGDYFFLILQTEGDGGDPEKPQAVVRLTGNVELRNQLVEIRNVGDEVEIYKGYEVGPDDKHMLRTLKQLDGGQDIIKTEVGDEADTIDFRAIKQGTAGQIKVRTEGDAIIVEGNYISGGTGGFATLLNWDDGLVTGATDLLFGLDAEIAITDGCGTFVHDLTFKKGLLTAYSTTSL